jgi:phosphoketolase
VTRIAEGHKGLKSFELLFHELSEHDRLYVARLRESGTATRPAGVYHKATVDFFGIVADCNAWLEEAPMVEP